METIDPERERQRLAEKYSQMADGELEALATDFISLTDAARIALKIETARRGLNIILEDPPPPAAHDVELPELVAIRSCESLGEAIIAKGFLESAGIENFLFDDRGSMIDVNMADPICMPLIGSIILHVKADDAEEATGLLEPPPESEDEE